MLCKPTWGNGQPGGGPRVLARARPRLSLAGLPCEPRKQPLAAQTRPRTRPRGMGCRSRRRSTQRARTGSRPSCPSSAERQGVGLDSSETDRAETGARRRWAPGNPSRAPGSVSPAINKGRRLAAWVCRAGVGALYIFLGREAGPCGPALLAYPTATPAGAAWANPRLFSGDGSLFTAPLTLLVFLRLCRGGGDAPQAAF